MVIPIRGEETEAFKALKDDVARNKDLVAGLEKVISDLDEKERDIRNRRTAAFQERGNQKRKLWDAEANLRRFILDKGNQ